MARVILFVFVGLMPFIAGAALAPAAQAAGQEAALKAERVLVVKAKRMLYLLRDGQVLRRYRVALGRSPSGRKTRQGDGRTPEGVYRLDWRNPNSRYHRSIHVSYPNEDDRRRAARHGVPPGGDIMIHGLPPGLDGYQAEHVRYDWTDGCIAVTDDQIDEIWALVENGTVIEIRP